MTNQIEQMASEIVDIIKKSDKILLHCHPYPDPDSIGSVLAMAGVLKEMGKNVTSIIGDTEYPPVLLGLPNHDWIIPKKYSEINPGEFDLFIILDSSSIDQISRLTTVIFPKRMKTIVIDHHATNTNFGDVNLIEPLYSSTSQILYDLFKNWGVEIDANIALCLFMGIYADTGGFKYLNTTPATLKIASELASINPNYHKIAFDLENSKAPIELEMTGLALSSIEKFLNDRVVMSVIPYEEIEKRNLSKGDAMEGLVADKLRSVVGWNLVASLVEAELGITTVSMRTRNENKFDVSKIAMSVGQNGGGHRGAAGTTILEPAGKAKQTLLDSIVKLFPEIND